MLSNGRLLRKLRKVMGAAVTLPSLVACSSQICCAGVYECSIERVNYRYDDTTGCLTISGAGEVTGSLTYLKDLQKLGAKFPVFRFLDSIVVINGLCGIKHVIIKDGITKIGKEAFQALVTLEDIVIPNSVTEIGECAFDECISLKNITIPESVKKLQGYTFNGCVELEEIKLPNNLESIEDFVFSDCKNLKSITIPESVKELGRAFKKCERLEKITLPSHIEGIASGLFFGCKNLKAVNIPSSIKYIHYSAFRNCENLSKVEFYSPMDDLKRKAELKYPNDPKGRAKYYVENCPEKWRYFGHIFHAMKEKTGSYLVGLNKNLVEFLVSGLVIYPFSFQGCKKLKKISLPLNTRFNVGEEDVSPVTIDDIILRSDKLKKPCGCCFARCSKLSDFFEPNMEVEIGGKTYRVE